jgi:hypothetical protein
VLTLGTMQVEIEHPLKRSRFDFIQNNISSPDIYLWQIRVLFHQSFQTNLFLYINFLLLLLLLFFFYY